MDKARSKDVMLYGIGRVNEYFDGQRRVRRQPDKWLKRLAEECPFVSDVRGKGLMIGIDFARPKNSFKLKMAWDMLHTLNFGVFGQMIVMPLMHDHRILTQVAGYHTEVIKFLPPMTINESDCDWFLGAMKEVLEATQRPGAAWQTVAGLAKSVVRA